MPRRGEPTERTCIVTRETLPVERLIRFVVAPDGSVVADLRRRLPGRGVWVKAEAGQVRAAERRNLFARGFDQTVKVDSGLAERVEESLRTAALGALSLARKAGEVVAGFAKVEAALAGGEVVGLIHAAEASEDGVAKLAAALRRSAKAIAPVPVIRIFTGEQLDLAFGRANVIHAALLAGPASRNTLFRVRSLADFLGEGMGAGNRDRAVAVASNVSAGPLGIE